jgi:hypothetical protein
MLQLGFFVNLQLLLKPLRDLEMLCGTWVSIFGLLLFLN